MVLPFSPASQAQALAALRSFLLWPRTMGAHDLSPDVITTALRSAKADVRRPYVVLSEPDHEFLTQGQHVFGHNDGRRCGAPSCESLTVIATTDRTLQRPACLSALPGEADGVAAPTMRGHANFAGAAKA